MRRKFFVFLTPAFKDAHQSSMRHFRTAGQEQGTKCGVLELDTEDNAKEHQTAGTAVIIRTKIDFSNFVRKLATLEREHNERGRFLAAL